MAHQVIKKKTFITEKGEPRQDYLEAVQDWFKLRRENNSCTPDAPKLNKYHSQRVFIYGTMKHNFGRNTILGNDATCLGVGYTGSQYLKLYKHKTAGDPIAMPVPNISEHAGCGRVYGELWDIPTKELFALDYYENNGYSLTRRKIPVSVHLRTSAEHATVTYAWMYLGKTDHWKNKMDQLELCELLTKNKDNSFHYFIYMKKDEIEFNAKKNAK